MDPGSFLGTSVFTNPGIANRDHARGAHVINAPCIPDMHMGIDEWNTTICLKRRHSFW
jgi:hypothetical protein